jgi:hypothetical protein
MSSWAEFAEAAPELAAFGAERFRQAEVAYLATVRGDGSPRVHPVTPILGGGRLFLFMEPASPKDTTCVVIRVTRYSLVTDQDGSPGEFIRGRARPVNHAATRAIGEAALQNSMDRLRVSVEAVDVL